LQVEIESISPAATATTKNCKTLQLLDRKPLYLQRVKSKNGYRADTGHCCDGKVINSLSHLAGENWLENGPTFGQI
jgi:hypothetical protein